MSQAVIPDRRRVPRSRTSCLAVPGSSPRMLDKARRLPVAQVVLDLEDAVRPEEKAAARGAVVSALTRTDWVAATRSVRVNACDSPWNLRDVEALVTGAGAALHTVVVPKAGSARDVHYLDRLLSQLEREAALPEGHVGLELQIEDAHGLLHLDALLGASPRIEAVLLGPGDLAAALGLPAGVIGAMDATYPGDSWHWVRGQLLVHARAHGVQAIDGPYARVPDLLGLRETAAAAYSMGFDGKWVIHPDQIEVVEEIFAIAQDAFEWAHDVLEALASEADAASRGALLFGDVMIDEASRRMADLIAARGSAAGLVPRPVPADVPVAERARWRRDHAAG